MSDTKATNLKMLMSDFASEHLLKSASDLTVVHEIMPIFKVWYLKKFAQNSAFRIKDVAKALEGLGYLILNRALIGYKLVGMSGRQVKQPALPASVKERETAIKLCESPAIPKIKFLKKSLGFDTDKNSTGNRIYKNNSMYRRQASKRPYPISLPALDDFTDLLIKTAGKDVDECCAQAVASIRNLREKRKKEEVQNFYKDSKQK